MRPPRPVRAIEFLRTLPDHALLDRLVRGRAWIPVLGVLLAGIVAMQVEVLKLGTSMGRWVERSSALQTQNEALQENVASLADDQRIERLAAGMGMVMAAPTAISFLPMTSGEVGRALANIHAPDPTGFAAQLPSETTTANGSAAGSSTAATTGSIGSATYLPGGTSSSAPATVGATASPTAAAPPPTGTSATSSSAAAPGSGSAAPGSGSTAPASGSTAPTSGPASPAVGTTSLAPATQAPATGAAAIAPTGSAQSSAGTGG